MASAKTIPMLKISNLFFYANGSSSNVLDLISTKGFTLYCYLMGEQDDKKYIVTTLKTIIQATSLGDVKTIQKYLEILHKKKFISYKPVIPLKTKNIGINDIIEIRTKFIKQENNYFFMNYLLFLDYIKKIGANGWTLLCILSALHDYRQNGGNHDAFGYAYPSYKYLTETMKVSLQTLTTAIKTLEENNLIEVIREAGHEEHFEDFSRFVKGNNKYVAKNRIPNNKYFLEMLWILIKKARESSSNLSEHIVDFEEED